MTIAAGPGLLAAQYADSPRLKAVVSLFADLVQDELVDPLERFAELQDIDRASGAWLDRIGGRLGCARPYVVVSPGNDFWGFDEAGQGFDQHPFVTDSGVNIRAPMTDRDYRGLLHARGFTLQSPGSAKAFRQALSAVYAGAPVDDQQLWAVIGSASRAVVAGALQANALPNAPGIALFYDADYGADWQVRLGWADTAAMQSRLRNALAFWPTLLVEQPAATGSAVVSVSRAGAALRLEISGGELYAGNSAIYDSWALRLTFSDTEVSGSVGDGAYATLTRLEAGRHRLDVALTPAQVAAYDAAAAAGEYLRVRLRRNGMLAAQYVQEPGVSGGQYGWTATLGSLYPPAAPQSWHPVPIALTGHYMQGTMMTIAAASPLATAAADLSGVSMASIPYDASERAQWIELDAAGRWVRADNGGREVVLNAPPDLVALWQRAADEDWPLLVQFRRDA